MVAISAENVGQRDGKQLIRAVLMSNTVPDPLPQTGDGITGMNADQVFAPFSFLFIAGDAEHKVYVTGENGLFIPQ